MRSKWTSKRIMASVALVAVILSMILIMVIVVADLSKPQTQGQQLRVRTN